MAGLQYLMNDGWRMQSTSAIDATENDHRYAEGEQDITFIIGRCNNTTGGGRRGWRTDYITNTNGGNERKMAE